ncbi:hypothetical protein DL93DRAFT_2084167 [Clavulina sp. PMI_390]|nr:hypothetical protein DL93DRAFT_2084167 [Clavulina sp. PMI_390]
MTSAAALSTPHSDDEDHSSHSKKNGPRESDWESSGRNEDLTLMENLELGPHEHHPPKGDPKYLTIEPYSNINLASRALDYDDMQEFMRARYYISPSTLYSVARLSHNRQAYEVPVAGDWITIAVIAERGAILVSRGAKQESDHESEEEQSTANAIKSSEDASKPPPRNGRGAFGKKNQQSKGAEKKPKGKKYITLRLVDFGRRSTDPHTGKITIGGDALLNMILFEADSFETIQKSQGGTERLYRGGSGGAFEASSRWRAGTVIAIMNPKILKPFQRGSEKPHPTANVLAITPPNAGAIRVIGQSKDLGHCPAKKADGTICGSWCDKRVHEVCEYHITRSVKEKRAGRSEFASGTSSMAVVTRNVPGGGSNHRASSTSSASKDYDPSRKWGLLPSNASISSAASKTSATLGGGTTYVMPGMVISSVRDKAVSEVMGRERAEKTKREAERKALERLLESGGADERSMGAARAVLTARDAVAALRADAKGSGKDKGKGKEKDNLSSSLAAALEAEAKARPRGGSRAGPEGEYRMRSAEETARRAELLKKLGTEKTNFNLGRMPGPKVRSGVSVPTEALQKAKALELEAATEKPRTSAVDDDDSDDDLIIE